MNRPLPAATEPLTMLSIVIPAHNEEDCLESTVRDLYETMQREQVPHEIVVVDDGSTDSTWQLMQRLAADVTTLRPVQNLGEHGFGRAITFGFDQVLGDAVVVMMADASDDAGDAVKYWRLLNQGWDAVFGSRFIQGSRIIDYPSFKLAVNRLANFFLRVLFNSHLNDTTNAFKAYRRTTLDGCRPFLSPHFNLTVELPLKTMIRGYSWTITPISWRNRQAGVSKLKLKEMGSRYLFIALYCWLEKYFSRGDYLDRRPRPAAAQRSKRAGS
jgi:dolichol-phosphate mannosyltransferase